MKISIVTVCFNSSNTIRATIESVISQKDDNVEYIIIDAQSMDGTVDIIQEYADCIDYFVSESDRGIYDAMNKGISIARGDVIGILNSDDLYEPNILEKIRKAFEQHPSIDVVYGDISIISSDGTKERRNRELFQTLFYQMAVPHPATFVRKTVYERIGVFDDTYKIAGDFEILNRFWNNGVRFGYINTVVSDFRTGGISSQKGLQIKKEVNRVVDKYFDGELFIESCFGEVIDDDVPLFIWGMGVWGKRIATIFATRGIRVSGCIDLDEYKWGDRLPNGMTISSPDELNGVSGQVLISILDIDEAIVEDVGKYSANLKVILLKDCLVIYGKRLAERNGDVIDIAVV